MENKNKKSKGIPFLGVLALILAFAVGWLISDNNRLKRENQKKTEHIQQLEQNQKPTTELYNENNKPCAGC